tara:strand:+ start:122 stop:409 length:288 start_codon:yes stop_codon:yes gene_type:complete
MKIKEIKETLQKGEVRFTIPYLKNYKDELLVLKTSSTQNHKRKLSDSIWEDDNYGFGNGMNVTKWGPTCVTLYTFDLFKTRTVAKIKYSDITIIN